MSDFKVGGKVRRVDGLDTHFMKKGCVYTICEISALGDLCFEEHSKPRWYNKHYFTTVEDTSNYYKHYNVVIAWMQGKEVQTKCTGDTWASLRNAAESSVLPAFNISDSYRIKPESCPKEAKLTSLVSKLEEQLKEAQEQLKEMRNG
tara:strand:- start:5332 stop:5772 length:441 start_codon:yes stop_codon:yes gene_type:complete